MTSTVTDWLPVIVTSSLLVALLTKARGRDILVYLGAFYVYFSFGPFLSFLLGRSIYSGTIVHQIPSAVLLMTLAIAGMIAVAIVMKSRQLPPGHDYAGGRRYPLITVVLALLSAFSIAILLTAGPAALALDKHSQIALVGADVHYAYLLIQFCAASLYFLVQPSKTNRIFYTCNFALYAGYCLVFSERDFIFAIASILLHRFMTGQTRLRPPHFLAFGLLLYGATYLFQLRSGAAAVDLASVLNQGSLLFVDTFTISVVPDIVPFMYGWTYLNSVMSLLPDFLYATDFYLLNWFVSQYAPGSPSGYGFSLEAEAYLNFGYVAVPAVFATLAVVQRLLANRLSDHPFFAYISVFYVGWLMYSFRGDSLQLIHGVAYAGAFFGLVYIGSRRRESVHDSHVIESRTVAAGRQVSAAL